MTSSEWFHFQACLYLFDVPSVDHPGQILGSVVFGESFLDSAIKTLIPGTNHLYFVSDAELFKTVVMLTLSPCFTDSSSVWNSSFVILTENIPRFVSWKVK